MKTALLCMCVAALSTTAQATPFCTFSQGTWCEQPIGPDAGQYITNTQYTNGSGTLSSIQGEINGLGGADLFDIYIPNPSAFAASYTPQSGTSVNGDSQAAIYLLNPGGTGIEAADDGTALTGFTGAAGIYLIGITGDGNLPQYNSGSGKLPIFAPFVSGQVSFPVTGAGDLSAYSGNGCGQACAGGYDISLTGANYSGVPEPATLALTGSAISMLGLLFRIRRRR